MTTEREQAALRMITAVMNRYAARLQGHQVVLFGSRASHTARRRSDFDIGVMGDEPLSVQGNPGLEKRDRGYAVDTRLGGYDGLFEANLWIA